MAAETVVVKKSVDIQHTVTYLNVTLHPSKKNTFIGPMNESPAHTKDTKIDAAATNTVDLEPQPGPYPKTLSWEAKFQVPSPVCCVWWMFHTIVIHPAGWVIESGGVALLMFVDPVSLGIFQWISCFLPSFVSTPWVLLFFCALAITYGHFIPRKVLNFWWVISQSDCGAMVLAHESVFFLCSNVWSHVCQGFASQRHQKRIWKLIEKIATYLEDVFQGMPTFLEVDRKDNNVVGRCLTRDANVVGSW